MKKDDDQYYDEDVNYDVLKKTRYKDTPGYTFYTCPVCGNEYLATFIISHNGKTMCIDCANLED